MDSLQQKKERVQDLLGFSEEVDEAKTEAEFCIAAHRLQNNCRAKRRDVLDRINVLLLSEAEWHLFLRTCMKMGLLPNKIRK